MTDSAELPVWARDDAFPEAGPGPWGFVDRKGGRKSFDSFAELERSIVEDAGARVDLVWTPHSTHLLVPEEIPALHPALREARLRWARWEIDEGKRQMLLFGAFIVLMAAWNGFRLKSLLSSGSTGLAIILFLILGFIPWYQGRKRLRKALRWAAGEMAADAPVLRFETWLGAQKAPFTRFLLLATLTVGIVQMLVPGQPGITVVKAGLTKHAGAVTEWWRLFTAPFLHGHPIHWLMNASALAYLGKRVEAFARWPHVMAVFLFAAWLGGEASARFIDKPSVGASGGIMGLLGFLLVFETLHRRLVPESSRRRLLAGVMLIGVIGVLGFKFIDNAAHAGGLLAGMLYAAVVFPRSASPHRPRTTPVDLSLGSFSTAVLAAAAVFTCVKLLL